MKAAFLIATMLIATPALAANDADYCRQQAADMLEVGKILVDDMKDDKPEITEWRLRALVLLCMGGGARIAEPGYEVRVKPPASTKKVAKKAPAAWEAACRKFISYNAKDGTVVTTKSAPARIPCPYKPKE
jgi:hypothetical protein